MNLRNKIIFSVLICGLLFPMRVMSQREIDLAVTAIVKPDTVFRAVRPTVEIVFKNLGPDSIYTTDTLWFDVTFGSADMQDIRFPEQYGVKWYEMPFPKDLGKDDSFLYLWQCPSSFDIPITVKGWITVGAWFYSGNVSYCEESNKKFANNGFYKDKVVYYRHSSDIVSYHLFENIFFPNPISSDGIINIKNENLQGKQILIFDSVGKLILTHDVDNSAIVSLDISSFRKGMYTIVIASEQETIIQKFIK